MKKSASLIFVLLLVVGSFISGTWYNQRFANQKAAPGGGRILYYHDPMHPAYKSDKPGIAPDCGMKLEPVYADEGPTTQGLGNGPSSFPPGTVQVSPEKQQLIGVQLALVEKTPYSLVLRTVGRVTADENRIFRVAAPVDGWVRTAGPIVTGNIVRKDEVLATFYNRDFLTAQQTYLYALNTMDRFKDKESPEQLKLTQAQMQGSEENLEFLGMGQTQLQEVARTRQIARNVEFRSPVAGLVLARNAYAGLRFDRGTELFRIADIGHVWILADLFENEARYFRPGAKARVVLASLGEAFQAKVSEALPQFDPNSRTLKVRLEADNPGYALRPDMFVDVELRVRIPAAITVPADAVLDSGLKKTVFLTRGNGYFEPRSVQTGWRYGDRVEIVKGLSPGERIVISGNFLIDSESRMKLAIAGMGAKSAPAKAGTAKLTDPVCGMEVKESESATAGRKSEHQGKTYYFCSDHCKQQFDHDPDRYLANTTSGEAGQHD